MTRFATILVAVIIIMPNAVARGADEVRYYNENGVTYRETRRTEQVPVYQTTMQSSTQTVYREQWSTEQQASTRTCYSPVTEYRPETYWVGRWNPFVEPYLATRYMPYTRWEAKTETVQSPVCVRRIVPETQTVQAPVTVQQLVPQEVITRVAVSAPAWGGVAAGQTVIASAAAPQGQPVGGLARLNQDPPRQGIQMAQQPTAPVR